MRNEKGQFQYMREDLTGRRFGRLVALNFSHKDKNRKTYWDFICDCGEIKTLRSDCVKNGSIQSCGCMKKEQDYKNLRMDRKLEKTLKTDETYSTLARRYAAMKQRCYDSHSKQYKNYGGRGIKVCDEWLHSFKNYYEWCISHGYRKELEIDRIDNDGNYEPLNCRFVTRKENVNNRRCSKKYANSEITTQIAKGCAAL